jgi:hypothetical protein
MVAAPVRAGTEPGRRHPEIAKRRRHGEMAVRVIAMKPHHFVDIIADYGLGRAASEPNDYHNDLPGVTAAVLGDPAVMLRIDWGADDICKPCVHNINGLCDDSLDPWHGPQVPKLKRQWNLLLDRRWSERLGLAEGDQLTARALGERIQSRQGDLRGIYRELPPSYAEEKAGAIDLGLARYLAPR